MVIASSLEPAQALVHALRLGVGGGHEQDGGGADVFVHYSAIESGGYRELQEGQKVEFDVTQGPKGPQAEKVKGI